MSAPRPTVVFGSVGRRKLTWTAELPSLSERSMLREIRQKGALASDGVDFRWGSDGTDGLIVVGGFRVVGTFRVIDAAKVTVQL
jgi:hypothetical protein